MLLFLRPAVLRVTVEPILRLGTLTTKLLLFLVSFVRGKIFDPPIPGPEKPPIWRLYSQAGSLATRRILLTELSVDRICRIGEIKTTRIFGDANPRFTN